MTKLSRPLFPRAAIRYDDIAERDQAWQWIAEGLVSTTENVT